MAEDVTVVDVLPTEVDQLVHDGRSRIALRIDVVEHPMIEPREASSDSTDGSQLGNSKGRVGMTGRKATMVSSSGEMRTVSFQPSSLGSGGMMMLSQVTRLSTWTS